MTRARLPLTLLALAGALVAPAEAQTYDLVVAHGRVVDPESGLDAVRFLGIRGDRIAVVSTRPLVGRDTIDARGLVVAPGFIDLHRHASGDNSYRYQIRDGVTTALELEIGTDDVAGWYAARSPGVPVNYGVSAGHIPARMRAMGDSGFMLPTGPARGEATVAQMRETVRLVEQGLAAGAVSVGMGLAYTPDASAMEVLQVFRAAAAYHVPVHVHLRGGPSGLIEVIGHAAAAGSALHVAHVNSTAGRNIGVFLEAIEGARRQGLDVTTEAYPYTAGATLIQSALYDGWQSWPDERFAQLQWAATGERLTRETFATYRAQGGSVISHSNTEAALSAALASPLTMIVSDGGRDARDEPTHPRATGTFARILGRYVRSEGTLTLMEAIRKMTLAPAQRLEARVPGMRDRGRIRAGAFADLTIFDPATVTDRSTYENPAQYSDGIPFVLVNGVPVVRDGAIVPGRAPGRPVRAEVASGR